MQQFEEFKKQCMKEFYDWLDSRSDGETTVGYGWGWRAIYMA